VRFFASARDAAGTRETTVAPGPLAAILAGLRDAHPALGPVLDTARVWVNGEEPEAGDATPVAPGDEVAVLPPVSGGLG